jgi:GNAT superfamily N-acetyltransferase
LETQLAEIRLADGTALRIFQIEPPDTRWEASVRALLAHKPRPYDWHIDQCFKDKCEGLETRFSIGVIDDVAVANVMTVERAGIGILGHVYTHPDHRQRGISRQLLTRHLDDFRARGGYSLILGTQPGGHAAALYASLGFRDIPGATPGTMRWDNPDPRLSNPLTVPGISVAVPADWRHWPSISLLGASPSESCLRSVALGLRGSGLLENAWCAWMARSHRRYPAAQAVVIENPLGAVTALATRVPDPRWMDDVHILDFLAYPEVPENSLRDLIAPFFQPDLRIQSVVDPKDAQRIAVLESLGMTREAVLPRQLRHQGVLRDLWVYGTG